MYYEKIIKKGYFGLLFLCVMHYTSAQLFDLKNIYFFTPTMKKCCNNPTNVYNEMVSDNYNDIELTCENLADIEIKNPVTMHSSPITDKNRYPTCIKIIHSLAENNYDTLFKAKNAKVYVFINPTIHDILYVFSQGYERNNCNNINQKEVVKILGSFRNHSNQLSLKKQYAFAEKCLKTLQVTNMDTFNQDIHKCLTSVMQAKEPEEDNVPKKPEFINSSHAILPTLFAIQLSLFLLIMCKQSYWYLSAFFTVSTMVGLAYGGSQLYKTHQESLLT